MKKTLGLLGVAALSLLAITTNAQTDSIKTTTTVTRTTWEAKNNPTVDSINAKYRDKMLPARAPLTTADYYPVLGEFESSTNTDAAHLTITQDETNKGVIWITGLPQGKLKAMLRRSPSTYKIPDQKNEEGKDVVGGTLIFDKETNSLSILLGKEYDITNPESAFAPVVAEPATTVVVKDHGKKTKVKKAKQPVTWTYTGTKLVKETVAN
jgi:hypothetical protein